MKLSRFAWNVASILIKKNYNNNKILEIFAISTTCVYVCFVWILNMVLRKERTSRQVIIDLTWPWQYYHFKCRNINNKYGCIDNTIYECLVNYTNEKIE